MTDTIHKILNQMEALIVDLKIELLDNDMDTALRRKKRDHVREVRSKGGKKRAENLSPERRSEISRNAVKARWAKRDELLGGDKESWIQNNSEVLGSIEKGLLEASEGNTGEINMEDL